MVADGNPQDRESQKSQESVSSSHGSNDAGFTGPPKTSPSIGLSGLRFDDFRVKTHIVTRPTPSGIGPFPQPTRKSVNMTDILEEKKCARLGYQKTTPRKEKLTLDRGFKFRNKLNHLLLEVSPTRIKE